MPPKDRLVWKYFEERPKLGIPKQKYCTLCNRYSCQSNATRERTHLVTICKENMEAKESENRGKDEIQRKRPLSPNEDASPIVKIPRQTTLTANGITYRTQGERLQERIEALLTRFIVMSGSPFSLVENSDFQSFIKILDPAFKLPNRERLSGELLADLYHKTSLQVQHIIDHRRDHFGLNFCLDESNNQQNDRVLNFSVVHPDFGSLTLHTRPVDAQASLTGEFYYEYFRSVVKPVVKGDYKRINSISTDTCKTMRKFWKLCQNDEELSHIICVPCQSHSLNLLIGDIIKMDHFRDHFTTFKNLVRDLSSSNKTIGEIKKIQQENGRKYIAFASAVETRWGSHIAMLKSLQANRDPIQEFFFSRLPLLTGDAIKKLKPYRDEILAPGLWNELDRTLHVLDPITKALKKTESSRLDIGRVVKLWNDLRKEVESAGIRFGMDAFAAKLLAVFDKRYQDQLDVSFHHLAFYIHPEFRKEPLQADSLDYIKSTIQDLFFPEEEDVQACLDEIMLFKSSSGIFASNKDLAKRVGDPEGYWRFAEALLHSSRIASIAARIFSAPTSSVPSERAFSIQNLTMSAKRSRLDPERCNKMMYIYMNRRSMDAMKQERKERGVSQIEMEDLLLQIEEEIGLRYHAFDDV